MASLSIVSTNRITREVKELVKDPPAGISAWPRESGNISQVDAAILGPEGTPYAGGLFYLQVDFPARYPHEPPNVKFKTKVYHPNVAHDGNICLSVLNMPPKGDWKPALNLRTVLMSIQSLLADPNPDDPLDADAAKECKLQPELFKARAAEWTRRYASAPTGAGPSAAASGAAREAETAAPGCSAAPVGRAVGSGWGESGASADAAAIGPSPGAAPAASQRQDSAPGGQSSQPAKQAVAPSLPAESTSGQANSGQDGVGPHEAASGSAGVQAAQSGHVVPNLGKRGEGPTAPKSRLALTKRARTQPT